jgi:DNA-binding beta-propeller fold protein YncE
MSVILVTDQHVNRLLVLKPFTESGVSIVGSPAPLNVPNGLCVDGQGNVFVADGGNHCIAVRDLWSSAWQTVGVRGSGTGEFIAPSGVAVDGDGRLHIVDTGNRRIVRMNAVDANGWLAYGATGKPTPADPDAIGKFAEPRGIALDERGRICVTDPAARRVVRISAMDGTDWTVLPLPAGGNPAQPLGIAAGNEWLAVSDVGNGKVYIFDLDDNLVATLDATSEGMPVPAYVAIDAEYLVVADIVSNELRRFRLDGAGLVTHDGIRGSSPAHITPLFQHIGGIASGAR